jgi:hypothetical protein
MRGLLDPAVMSIVTRSSQTVHSTSGSRTDRLVQAFAGIASSLSVMRDLESEIRAERMVGELVAEDENEGDEERDAE